ncbi:DNA/RNA nuclease SfsA [Maricurvus nonylphenolicus]|uniref:DNA/RNA nuclease SfsA n=1 Tax=Maricurvus nonylphenolicus TaxID=1008307 RepID=UPI0036F3B066
MKFSPPLQQATLLKRYKRFLADIRLDNGNKKAAEETTIHCPNTGSMKNCWAPETPCWFSVSDNPKRKYPFTWEIATTPAGDLAGINTGRANALVVEAINDGVITELQGYDELRTEVKYGEENSRIDILLSGEQGQCYVEIKNCTLLEDAEQGPAANESGKGYFPDAVSTRGTKHLRELIAMVEAGHRAVLLFCVQHSAIESVTPAAHIDSAYAETFAEAVDAGVEVLAYRARLSPEEIKLEQAIPVETV